MGVYGEILCLLSDQAEISDVSEYIKNVDTHNESFSSKQVIKKLSSKSLWQTCMKWTVDFESLLVYYSFHNYFFVP